MPMCKWHLVKSNGTPCGCAAGVCAAFLAASAAALIAAIASAVFVPGRLVLEFFVTFLTMFFFLKLMGNNAFFDFNLNDDACSISY
jgi:hypothetical protein